MGAKKFRSLERSRTRAIRSTIGMIRKGKECNALEMANRPVFVRLGLNVPLCKKDANREATPLSSPQVYIRPLNVNANHFTLLEID